MYLTKLRLSAEHPNVRLGLVNAHEMHRNLMGLYNSKRVENNVLYTTNLSEGACDLYLQSDIAPDLSNDNLSRYGMEIVYSITPDKRGDWREGTVHRFILDAAPCKNSVGPHGGNARRNRYCLTDASKRMQWLERKGETGGFKIVGVSEHAMPQTNILRSGMQFTYPKYRYTGELIVTDEVLFRKTVQKGLGPGKSYGLGLLLVV